MIFRTFRGRTFPKLMKRILVTGISGFLGWHFARFMPSKYKLIGIFNTNKVVGGDKRFWEIDITDFEYFHQFMDQMKPDAIIHTAAMSRPADCEKYPDLSYKINVVVPTLMADYARSNKIPFVFTSSDLVFNGRQGKYHFDDIPDPVNLYGRQKFEAERRILSVHPAATIVRLPLLYGFSPHHKNFIEEWSERLLKGKKVHAFTDEYRSALRARDAVKGIVLLLEKKKVGIWHLGGPDKLSRYKMGQLLAKELGLSKDLIKGSLIEDKNPFPARPADVTLNSRNTNALGFDPKSMKDALTKILPKVLKKLKA